MSSAKNPLMLMMALSMPGAADALGLGDIHVDSGLNERLAAEIDIVGATALDLADLRAAVANRETFLRYGADRPTFLSSATFKVTQDSQGRPVLAVRSTESFTEPLVNFLIDVRWRNGELVRQYTLLLDPPGFPAANRPPEANLVAAAAPIPSTPAIPDIPATPAAARAVVETKTQTVARRIDQPSDQPSPTGTERAARKTTHVKVGAKATLRGVAWRIGERSKSDLQRMMIAIFRANPTAFDANINRLHRGAVLTIPSRTEVAAISKAEARHEVHAQMAAWRSPVHASATNEAVSPLRLAGAPSDATVTSVAVEKASATPAGEALGRRIQSMEQGLSEMKGEMESERGLLRDLQQKAASAEAAHATDVVLESQSPQAMNASQGIQATQSIDAPQAQPKVGYQAQASISAGLGILAAALAGLFYRFRRRAPTSIDSAGGSAPGTDIVNAEGVDDSHVTGAEHQAEDFSQPASHKPMHDGSRTGRHVEAGADARTDTRAIAGADTDDATHPLLPVLPAIWPTGRSEIAAGPFARPAEHDPIFDLHVDTVNLRADQTPLDYNFLDLDLTTQHVQMPSVLNEQAVVKERRTNLADVLKLAIEREPDRHDLRMKLLELYYSAAASNRYAFLEIVQKFARDRDYLQAEQWDKIAYMGRQIACDNPLFTEESAADDDLANCA